MDAKTRREVLLAAVIAEVLRQEGASDDDMAAAWARTETPHRSWAWNPRGPGAWRLAGRLQHHGRSRPGRT